MDDFGTISSIESLPLPEGPHVRGFDERQKAMKRAARIAKKAETEPVVHPTQTGSGLALVPTAKVPSPDRDTVTLVPPGPEVPYVYIDLDDQTFHTTLSGFVQQAQGHYAQYGLTLYYRILPGLQDAERRFKEHEGNPTYTLEGCKGIEEYVKKLGLKPATIRKWRQRDKERQFMREVKFLAGGPETCSECGRGKGHKSSCSHYVPPPPAPPEDETEAKILAQQCLRMTCTLVGPSVDSFPERVKKVISMAEAVQEAAAGGKYDAADFAPPIPSPEPQREPVPEPDPNSFEELRQRITRMADTNDIEPAVKTYLGHLFEPLRKDGLVLNFNVTARREGRERIESGDWVEAIPYRSGTTEPHAGRVVSRDKLNRPVIRWFEAGEWQKPRSQFANSDYNVHVLSAAEARDKYPEAFASYRQSKAEIEGAVATLSVESAGAATPTPVKSSEGL